MNQQTKDAVKEKREEFLKVAEAQAERSLNDQRFDWLRTKSARRWLCILTVLSVVVYAVGNFIDNPIIPLPALICYGVLLMALRTAGRTIVDLPEELVDERMRAIRGDVYRQAFIGAVGLFSMVMITDIVFALVNKAFSVESVAPFTADQWSSAVFALFFLYIALPSMIFVWREERI